MLDDIFVIEDSKGLTGCLMRFGRLTLFTGVEVNLLANYLNSYPTPRNRVMRWKERPEGLSQSFRRFEEGVLEDVCYDNAPPIIVFSFPEAFKHDSITAKFIDELVGYVNKYPNLQFVIITHSNTIFDGVRRNISTGALNCGEVEVNNLESLCNNTMFIRQIEIDQYGMCEEWPEGFFDQTSKDLDVILRYDMCK